MKNKVTILNRLKAEALKGNIMDTALDSAKTLDEAIITLAVKLDKIYKTKPVIAGADLEIERIFKKYGKYEGDIIEAKFSALFHFISKDVYEIRAKALTKATSKSETKVQAVVKTMTVLDKVKALRDEHSKANPDKPFKVGYARVSSKGQNLDRQLEALSNEGCAYIFEEKESGAKKDRKELELLLSVLTNGDMVVISELSRLARSTSHLAKLMEDFNSNGIALKSIKESWLDTSTPSGKLMFGVMSSIAEFERDIIKERQQEGIAIAVQKGIKFGTKLHPDSDLDKAIDEYVNQDGSFTVTEIAERHKISRTTLWRHLKKRGLLNNQA